MLFAKLIRRTLFVLCLFGIWQAVGPKQIVNAQGLGDVYRLDDDLQTTVLLSIRMVDDTLVLLSKGRSEMAPGEQAVFDLIFDPANTGQIDELFLEEVQENMRRIRRALASPIRFRYVHDNGRCIDQQLYYTDLVTVTVCPYFFIERDMVRKARGLVHEIAHIALLVVDRPYFAPHSKAYMSLTPRGGRSAQLPLIGRIMREVIRDDTLYHPDAYAHLSAAFSGIPGELALYERFLPAQDGPESAAAGHFERHH